MQKTTGLISKNQKEQILKATDIVQLIGSYVQLKASGKNYLGLCPFHKEKTPSFTVSPSHQNYKCYGCGEYGDAIRFVMEIENFQFVEAVKFLGDRCGVRIEFESENSKISQEANQVNHCLNLSRSFFKRNIQMGSINRPILSYIEQRRFRPELIERFELGYIPKGWTQLHDYLSKNNIPIEIQEKAGLIKKGEKGGYYDRLRNRLIFPIHDHLGKIIGFAGRALDGDIPKYLNPPETGLYKKNSVLYGLYQAKDKIRRNRRAFIVEGYLDLIRLADESWEETVATCGTALTEEHVALVKRFGASEAYLVFDGDKAGIAAAERSAGMFMASELDSKVIILPDELDPDDFFKQYQAEDFQILIDNAPYDYEFLIDQTRKSMMGLGIEQQKQSVESILRLADTIKEEIKRELFLSRVSASFNLNKQNLNSHFGQRKEEQGFKHPIEVSRNQARFSFEKSEIPEIKLIQYIISHRQSIVIVRTRVAPEDFFSPELSRLYARFLQLSDQEFQSLEPNEFPNIFIEFNHILAHLLHYKVEYSGPDVNRRRLPEENDLDKEFIQLEQDNRSKQISYSDTALKKLIQRVKRQKIARERKGLFQIDLEQERERVAALSRKRKQLG